MKQPYILTGMFLAEGFYGEKRRTGADPSHYQDLFDKFGGHVGIQAELCKYAELFTDYFLAPEQFSLNWPGELHYDVTSVLGEWLFYHLDEPASKFVEEFTNRFCDWVKI